ncbi:hypothetical protein pb186bvf_015687 [Paramecium bursaria]
MSDSDVEIIDLDEGIILQQGTIDALQDELNETQQQNAELVQKIDRLKSDIQQLKLEHNDSKQKQQVQELQYLQQIELKNQFIDQLKLQINELKEQYSKQLQDLSSFEAYMDALKEQLKEKQNQIQEYDNQNEDYKMKLILQETEHKQLITQYQELTKHNDDLKRENDQLSKKQAQSTEEYAKILEQHEEELNSLCNKLIQEEQLTTKLKQNVLDLSNEIKMKWDSKTNNHQFNEKLLTENIQNIGKIESLNQQLTALSLKIEKTAQQRDHFKQSFFESSSRILNLQKQNQQFQQQLQQQKETLQEKQDYITRNDNYQESYRRMQQLVKDNVEELKMLKQLIKQQQNQLEDYKRKEELLLKEAAHIKFQANQQIQSLKTQYDQSVIQLHQNIDNLHVSLSYKEKQIDSQSKTIQGLKEEINRFEQLFKKQLSEQSGSGEKVSLKQIKKQNQSILILKQVEKEKRDMIQQQLNQ